MLNIFQNWNTKKINLKLKDVHSKLIMEQCVYFVYCGTSIDSEINKLRLVIVWRKHENKEKFASEFLITRFEKTNYTK